ncbi:MAG TPA: ABC transporter permease [Kofleriaceae bacterium]|jgi:ABC-2 type transport system permease protein|nr:ABC transporter permease [Kofleriaceae bacterium]
MRATSIIFRRELGAYLRSPIGWVVAAALLLLDGLLFQAFAMERAALSADVLRAFFMWTSITTGIASIVLSVRLVAEERQTGSMVLLNTSPVHDVEIVVGKFLAAFVFLCGMVLLTIYMPLLIKVHGKITYTQIAVGYLGLFLMGATGISVGLFAGCLTRNQLAAYFLGGFFLGIMDALYHLGKVLDPPLRETFSSLDYWWEHFQLGFMSGVLNLKDVVYYGAVTYFFLLLSVKTLEAKRWQ